MNLIIKIRIIALLALGLLPFQLFAQGLISGNGTYIVPSGNIYINITNGGFANNGNFTAGSGTVGFSGTSALSVSKISGSGTTSFYDLLMNKTSNGLKLEQSIAISHLLDLQGGDSLFLNGYDIDLGTTGSISGEGESRRITGLTGGYIQVTRDLNNPSAVNPGNIGIAITSAANPGTTVIHRGHIQQAGRSVYRYFDITPTNNTSLNATIQFYYFQAELAGHSEGNLGVFGSNNAGSTWTNLGENGIDPLGNYVTLNNLNSLERLTLSDISLPLYVRLLYFKARITDAGNQLYWASATEKENDYYEVQRSFNGIDFTAIGRVGSKGNSISDKFYEFLDEEKHTGLVFYRLRMADINGRSEFSSIAMINRGEDHSRIIKAWPNPASDKLTLSIPVEIAGNYQIRITDLAGNTAMQLNASMSAGMNTVTFDISKLMKGVYQLSIPTLNIPATRLIKLQ